MTTSIATTTSQVASQTTIAAVHRAPAGRMIGLAHCLAAVAAVCALWARPARGQEPAELIAGIVARSQSITSGRLIYTFKSQIFHDSQLVNSTVSPETTTSFFDSNWAERAVGSHRVKVNHGGYLLDFVQTPQPNGSARPGATLLPPQTLQARKELNAPPLFAGGLWFPEQLQYVENNAAQFSYAGSADVDGEPVAILEATIKPEDARQAFHVTSSALKSGGTFRLFVASQLGFVLPRVEFANPSGQVVQSYNASGFSEVAPGIYAPQRVWTESHSAGNKTGYRAEFAIRYELTNQEIPPADFAVDLPIGTRVQDAREPGNVIHFTLRDDSSSADLPVRDIVTDSSWPPLGFFSRWGNAVIVGLLIGTVSSISLLLAARNQRYRV